MKLERKLSLRLLKLLGLFFGIVLFFSCNMEKVEKKMKESQDCQRQVLDIESFLELSENRLSLLENTIRETVSRDSLLTILVLQDSYTKENVNQHFETSKEQLDSFIEQSLAETSCSKFNKQKEQLKNILTKLKQTETQCDNYILLMNNISSRDSLYRKEINLEFVPFEILLKAKSKAEEEKTISNLECAKQLDNKITKLTKQVYYLTHSQNEIIEHLKTIKNTL